MKNYLVVVLVAALCVCAAWDASAQCPTAKPELESPERGARFTVGQEITFSWDDAGGETSFDLFVTPDFGQTFEPLVQGTTSRSHTTTMPAGDWGWFVRSNFPGQCPSTVSEPSHFFVGAQCDNPAPELLAPADNATVRLPVTFEWGAVPGAAAYEVYVAVAGELRLIDRTTDTSVELDHGVEGTVQWSVKADFPDNCPDTFAKPRTLTIQAAEECRTGEAEPLSPQNGAAGLASPVTFKWKGVSGATAYRLLAAIGGDDLVSLGTTTDDELVADVPAGSGYWIVQTFFGDRCPSTISDRFLITVVDGADCNEAGPILVSPANNATNVDSPVRFEWHASQNATRYALFVATSGDDFDFYGATDETELEAFVPIGVIRWFVVALAPGCPETRSAIFTFTAGREDNCPTGTITLQTPAQNATVASPVTLSWSALAGVQAYRLTVLIDGETSITRRTALTQETLELPAGEHRWYVEGIREECDPVVSNEGVFTIQRAANCDANQPATLIAPVGTEANPTIVPSPVTFRWNAAAGAIAYRLWVSRNGKAFEDIGITDKTEVTLPVLPGVYAWYLDAAFRGCDAKPSAIAYFAVSETEARCPGAAPTPLFPAQGSTVPAPVDFRWTSVRDDAKYRLFASIDGSEERLIGVTTDTQLTRVLPPGLVVYRVEAVVDECAARSSEPVSFTIPEASNCSDEHPELLSPANNATLTEQEVEFAWTPVSGAVRYVIVAQTEDGSRVPVGETTETSFSRRMPFGEIEWSVIALFAGCEPEESEEEFRFTITPNENCPNRSPILLHPSENEREVFSPVTFAWTRVPNAIGYQIWVPQGSPLRASVIAETTENIAEVELPPGEYEVFVTAKFATCPPTQSAVAEFTVGEPLPCGTPGQPDAHVVGQALSGTPYRLRWTKLANVSSYEVQESTSPDFANAETLIAEQPALRFVHEVDGPPVQYLYRVRGISNCDDSRGPYSDPVGIFVIAPRTNNASAEMGVEGTIVQKVVLPPQNPPLQFVANVDKPWLTVTPSSGTVGSDPVTLTVTADPAFLFLGTNTGTVRVAYTSPSSGNVTTHATTTVTVPISVSLVTPVTPSGKGTPPPDALIFPIVGHAAGVNDSLFESDIRVANLTPQTMKYQVNFTPSGTDGTVTGSSTTIEVPPNTTTALDDIVASVFGTGTISSALGMLEVRPLTTASTSPSLFTAVASTFPALSTAASSRTYNFTPNGTFGQFIPAVPFSKFVGRGSILSLLQVAQSEAYRANFGFAEAAGSPVDLSVRVYDTKNVLLATIPLSLGATQHTQLNGMLAANGINDLADGRVEVEVVSGDGKVTAYVSAIDNKTNDPLLVNAVPKGATLANRYVVPGMAYIDNGFAFWVSDLRIFNAGAASTPATLTFYPQGNGAPVTREITLDAGEIEVLDNVVGSLFAQPNGAGGAIAITTPANTQLSATARTYNQTANGTYGQFIPGVTVAESVGFADRALQLLQLETSSRMRTNVGVSETSGNPVTIEITAIQPDSIVTPVITLNLAANEFRQISLADFFDAGAAVYNARVTVKVIAGTGRVTAYGSAIDMITQDPTYVPAM